MLNHRWDGLVPVGQCVNGVSPEEALVDESTAQASSENIKKVKDQNMKVTKKSIRVMFFKGSPINFSHLHAVDLMERVAASWVGR